MRVLGTFLLCGAIAMAGAYAAAQGTKAVVIGGDEAPPATQPAPVRSTLPSDLSALTLDDVLMAKRLAGIAALKQALNAEIEAAIDEHHRIEKMLDEAMAKEQAKLASTPKATPVASAVKSATAK